MYFLPQEGVPPKFLFLLLHPKMNNFIFKFEHLNSDYNSIFNNVICYSFNRMNFQQLYSQKLNKK